MKKVLLSMTMIGALFMASCGEKEEGKEGEGKDKEKTEATPKETTEKEKAEQPIKLQVNTDASKVEWQLGNKMDSSYFHTGHVNLSDGSITMKDGKVVSGSFDIDMSSITNTDLPEEKKGKLEGHLKSGDFFNVSEHPIASFSIKSVEGNTVTGDLTVIGNTTEVTFDADMKMKDNSLVADASFMVDRFDIGITFMSEKDETPEEKRLQRHIQFNVHLEASK